MLKIRFFPVLILLLGLSVTFIISYSAFQDNRKLERQSFEKYCLTFEGKIQRRMTANTQILYSSAAFISSSDSISRSEWRKFQLQNKSHIVLPGMQGIGFLVIVDKKNVGHFVKQIQNEGFSNFKIVPEGDRDFYTAVKYIEPNSARNMQAIGFDAYTEKVRREAMDKARDNDLATITDKITLIQDSGKVNQPGVVIFAPVFKNGYDSTDAVTRKSTIVGWVFSTYQIKELMKNVLSEWDYQQLGIKVYDGGDLNPDNLMFDSDSAYSVRHNSPTVQTLRIPLNFNEHLWTFEFSGYKDRSGFLPARISFMLLNGFIISVLLFILVVSLINSRTRTLQIQKLNDELKLVNANKDRFVSLLAHDLKSPFNALLGFSELLAVNLDELRKDQIEMYVDRIFNSAKVSYTMLDELLIWARVQSNQFPFNPEKLNLNELCRSLVSDHQLVADKKQVSVSFHESEPTFVFADELMLKTILRNLLVNGIKFTNRGGSVQITLSTENAKVVVSVTDTGIGMSPEEVAQMFDVAHLKSKNGTANEKGTGLGLLLCKDMVKRNGGEIWIESTVGKGSIFSFSLPKARDLQ